jgi:hypothetical protein
MSSVRKELHRRLARGKWEAYAKAPETRHISYPDEWVYAPEATIMCPRFNGGEPQRFADDLATDEIVALVADVPDGDMLTPEIRMWWKHMPDWRLVSPFDCTATDWGFTVQDTYAGTTADGRVLSLREWDYIWTDEDGHITRWDWFVDSSEWNPYLELIGLDPQALTYQAYIANYLRVGNSP